MILVIVMVMVVYFLIAGVVGYLLGRAFGRWPLLIYCVLLGLAVIVVLILPMIGVDMEAMLGGDTEGNQIFGYSALLPALAGAVLFGNLGRRQRNRVTKKE